MLGLKILICHVTKELYLSDLESVADWERHGFSYEDSRTYKMAGDAEQVPCL